MTIFRRFVLIILPAILVMLSLLLFFSGREFNKRTQELTRQSIAADKEMMEILSNNLVFRDYFEYVQYGLKQESEIRRANITTLFEKTVSASRQGRHLINYIALYDKKFKLVAHAEKPDADSKPPAQIKEPEAALTSQIYSEVIADHHHRMIVGIGNDLNINQRWDKGEITGYLVVESILPLEIIGLQERSTLQRNIIVILFSISLMLILVIIAAAQITNPIKSLAEQTSRIGTTEEISRFVFKQNPKEIAVLGNALNRMLDDIDKTKEELIRARKDVEQQIVSRTDELVQTNQALQAEIAERKQMGNALRESEAHYRAMIDAFDGFMYICSPDYRIEFMNEPLIRRTGHDATGELCYRALHDLDSVCSWCKNDRVFAGESVQWELNSPKDRRWYQISNTPIGNADGTVSKQAMIIDITERKQTEEALSTVAKLDAIGTLAAGIAHDFNNLLGVMFGYLELSQMTAEKNGQTEIFSYLAQARSAFDRAKDLTGQLLTFSKGGAPARRTQSLSEHVRRIISFSLSGSNTAAEYIIPDAIWLCNFDENQIAQVLDNMVINARHAMPQGGTLNVSLKNINAAEAPDLLPSQDYVCLSLRDHGTGIAPEHLPHIFEPFFSTKKMGSGLGLATSYSIIRQHDGLIDVDSVLGKGTTFHIYLPASSGSVTSEAALQPSSHAGKGRILIMDDEDMILDVLSLMLENMGYEVVKTHHGNEAREAMQEMIAAGKQFTAAILDLTIPSGLGGKEIVYSLLALAPTIKVIASSGYAHDAVMSHPSDYGFAGRLTKPYRRSDLIAVLGSALTDAP